MRPELTNKQNRVLQYLKTAIQKKGTCPSLRTAAQALGISHAAVAQSLKALETKGYVKRLDRYSRTIHILDKAGDMDISHRLKTVPVIGRVTAGLPMYAQQEWDGSILVDAKIYPGHNLFALRIEGDSMKNAGILDQDIAVCEPRQYAQDREIIVALIHNEEATVKRFFLHRDHIELRPENPEFEPGTYAFDDIMIQGRIIGIVRTPAGMAML